MLMTSSLLIPPPFAPLYAYALLAASVFLGATGQILLKVASASRDGPYLVSPMINGPFVIAAGVYAVSLLLYVSSLRHIPLSIAYPSVGLSYVIVAYTSHRLWGTPFGLREIVALGLIVAGIGLLASASAPSASR
jgi:small multidrug resistance pump